MVLTDHTKDYGHNLCRQQLLAEQLRLLDGKRLGGVLRDCLENHEDDLCPQQLLAARVILVEGGPCLRIALKNHDNDLCPEQLLAAQVVSGSCLRISLKDLKDRLEDYENDPCSQKESAVQGGHLTDFWYHQRLLWWWGSEGDTCCH